MPSRRPPNNNARSSPKLTGTQARSLLQALLAADRAHSSTSPPSSNRTSSSNNSPFRFIDPHSPSSAVPGPFTISSPSPNHRRPSQAEGAPPFDAQQLFFPLPPTHPASTPSPAMKVTKSGNTVTVDSSTRLIGHLNVLAIPSPVNVMQQAESLADVIRTALRPSPSSSSSPSFTTGNADPSDGTPTGENGSKPSAETTEMDDVREQTTTKTTAAATTTAGGKEGGPPLNVNLVINASVSVVGSRNNIIMSSSSSFPPATHPALAFAPSLAANTHAPSPTAATAGAAAGAMAAAGGAGTNRSDAVAGQVFSRARS